MTAIWDYFKTLFREAEQSSPTVPFVHELIEREETDKADYAHWKNTRVRTMLSDWLSSQYALHQALPKEVEDTLGFLNTPSSNGFVIHFYKTNYSRRDLIWLAEYFKERVLTLDYRLQMSDVRTFSRNDKVEVIERHYLKPRPGASEKAVQRYGNITIEAILQNDRPYRLRFQASTYQDSRFKTAENFSDLMEALLA